ncbi:hypothetical protein NOV72_05371 [Caballeronia novacaledonica]|uniref:Uncharacterized protein n=1 Tax=Caballeronia novacaledonica TaxID=1544861 RepID=A0A2U3IDH3_9BURK|nr:hypothetical protein NOV72_05371 [Caballeronia novacaledonica]
MEARELIRSLLDFTQFARKSCSTYRWASSLESFADLDDPSAPVLRCRHFLVFSVTLTVLSLALLLTSLNLSVLNFQRGGRRAHDVVALLVGFKRDIAAAFSSSIITDFAITKQAVVLFTSISGSIVAAIALAMVANVRRVPTVERLRQLAFTSLILSTGFVHFAMACCVATCFVLLARAYDLNMRPGEGITLTVLLVVFAVSSYLTVLVRRLSTKGARGDRSGTANLSVLYSALAPACVALVLMSCAVWALDWFRPSVAAMLSESCGAPDRRTCVLTLMPKDIDGTVLLDGVRVQMTMEFADEFSIVGPKRLMAAGGYLRLIQNPDTPSLLELGMKRVSGVVQFVHFECPQNLSGAGRQRKLTIRSFVASADTHTVDIEDFDSIEPVQIKFSTNRDVIRLFRNSVTGCVLFP